MKSYVVVKLEDGKFGIRNIDEQGNSLDLRTEKFLTEGEAEDFMTANSDEKKEPTKTDTDKSSDVTTPNDASIDASSTPLEFVCPEDGVKWTGDQNVPIICPKCGGLGMPTNIEEKAVAGADIQPETSADNPTV